MGYGTLFVIVNGDEQATCVVCDFCGESQWAEIDERMMSLFLDFVALWAHEAVRQHTRSDIRIQFLDIRQCPQSVGPTSFGSIHRLDAWLCLQDPSAK
jgi:hypothetical protein